MTDFIAALRRYWRHTVFLVLSVTSITALVVGLAYLANDPLRALALFALSIATDGLKLDYQDYQDDDDEG